jgi:hypothetical protein
MEVDEKPRRVRPNVLDFGIIRERLDFGPVAA